MHRRIVVSGVLAVLLLVGCPTALTVSFTATPDKGFVALTVQFTGQANGTVSSWAWDFGDGGTSTEQNPAHTFTTAGAYEVTVTATAEHGSSTFTGYVTVFEPWARVYGGTGSESANAIIELADGGYVLAGYVNAGPAGGSDVLLVRTDANGGEEWSRTFGGTADEVAFAVRELADGGFVVVGYTQSFGSGGYDIYLVRTNQEGHMQWDQDYGGTGDEMAFDVIVDSGGGFVLAGETDSSGAGLFDMYLVRTSANGVVDWAMTYGGTGSESAASVCENRNGGYVVAGSVQPNQDAEWDVFVVGTDANGVQSWPATFGGTDRDVGNAVIQASDDSFIVCGTSNSFGSGDDDVYLIKVTGQGTQDWDKTYGGVGDESGQDLVQTADGGFAIAGWTASGSAGLNDVYLIKAYANGNVQWSWPYGGTGNDGATALVQASDGGYAMAGDTGSFGSGPLDVYFVKTNPGGIASSTPVP